jgi:hypothetical protein
MMPRPFGHGRDAVAKIADDLLDLLAGAGFRHPQAQSLGRGGDADVGDARHAGERGLDLAGAAAAVHAFDAVTQTVSHCQKSDSILFAGQATTSSG